MTRTGKQEVTALKIHDALVLELVKPDKTGKPTGDIIRMVGTSNFRYSLEEIERRQERARHSLETIIEEMAPDVLATILGTETKSPVRIAIELETDVDFDFGRSLRQIKKYRRLPPPTPASIFVVIPKDYEKFAPLYVNEKFRVYLWKAKRKYQCLQCQSTTTVDGPFKPKCRKCNNKYVPHRLIALEDTRFEEYQA